jgi:hypothetical protein
MAFPALATRMKENDNLPSDHARQISSLRQITFWASEAKVFRFVPSIVLAWNDVLNMEGVEIEIVLMDSTVFAAMMSPLPDERPSLGIDH